MATPQRRRLSFERACLIAIAATVALAVAALRALAGTRPHPAVLALCYFGVATGALALPSPNGRWRARRDGMRVGLAWVIVLFLGVALCVPVVYFLPPALVLAIEAPQWLVVVAAPVVAHIAVLRRARERRAALPPQFVGGWESGSAVPIVAVLLALLSVYFYSSEAPDHPPPPLPTALAALRQVQSCARRWTMAHHGEPPPDLATLGGDSARCIDASIASGRIGDWVIEYRPDPARVSGFAVVAREARRRDGYYRSLASDQSGSIHYSEGPTDADATSPILTAIPGEAPKSAAPAPAP